MADQQEQTDLDPGRQQEILAIEERIKSANHFEVLGIGAGASPEEVKNAFHELSRKFHPDRYFGKKLGPFKTKLDAIFRRLVEANQVLTDPDKRKAYLAANPFVRAAIRAAEVAAGTTPPPTESSAPKAEPTAEETSRDKERKSRLARHPYLARVNKVHELLKRAKDHIAKGEFSHAFTQLNLATQMEPGNQEVKTLLTEVRKSYDHMRSESDYKRGKDALDRGDRALALQAFKAAVSASAANAPAAFKAAELLKRFNQDPKDIIGYLQKAVDADPKNVDYRLVLAEALDGVGMKALAKKHLEEAGRLNPEHPEVKKYVKKRWPF